MAESAEELQNALNEFQMYCFEWKLTVNVDKTKNFNLLKGSYVKNKILLQQPSYRECERF